MLVQLNACKAFCYSSVQFYQQRWAGAVKSVSAADYKKPGAQLQLVLAVQDVQNCSKMLNTEPLLTASLTAAQCRWVTSTNFFKTWFFWWWAKSCRAKHLLHSSKLMSSALMQLQHISSALHSQHKCSSCIQLRLLVGNGRADSGEPAVKSTATKPAGVSWHSKTVSSSFPVVSKRSGMSSMKLAVQR